MKQQHVVNCSFSSWYPRFKNVTIPSKTISLPKEFIDYLNADSIVLPGKPYTSSNADDESDSEEWQNREEDPDLETAEAPEFNDVETKIKEAVSDLGGSVFPKLNWSAPKDASWITHNGTIRCKNSDDLYLLLKSSDIIAEELSNPFAHCEDNEGNTEVQYDLVLRKWMDIYPGMEFRCFVKDQELLAISQRDISSYYPFIKDNQDDIITDILSFYENKIADVFQDSCYVFDIYRYAEEKVLLIDFSPFGPSTNPLLFSWADFSDEELLDEDVPIFRAISSELGVQPGLYACSRLPKDMIDLSTGEDINKLVDFLNVGSLIQKPDENDNE